VDSNYLEEISDFVNLIKNLEINKQIKKKYERIQIVYSVPP
jgi:hypothetical protein